MNLLGSNMTMFVALSSKGEYKKGRVITLNQVLKAREKIEDFTIFCDAFLSNVIGRNEYNSSVGHTVISEMASVGDEAFAIVCVENSIDRWKEEVEDPAKTNKAKWKPTRYTANPSEASKYGGWSLEGIRRFNSLCQTIVPEMRQRTIKLEEEYVNREFVKRNRAKLSKRSMIAEYGEADVGWLEPSLVQAKTGTQEQPVNDGVFPNVRKV
jgi:hypothetical protein